MTPTPRRLVQSIIISKLPSARSSGSAHNPTTAPLPRTRALLRLPLASTRNKRTRPIHCTQSRNPGICAARKRSFNGHPWRTTGCGRGRARVRPLFASWEPLADRCCSYESLPPNFSLSANMLAGAFAGIAVCAVLRCRRARADSVTGTLGDVSNRPAQGAPLRPGLE